MFTTKNLLILTGRNMAIALLSVAISLTIVWFLSQGIKKTSSSIAENRRLAASLEERSRLSSVLKQNVQIIGKNDVLIEQAFLSSDNILDFIAAFESVARKNSIAQSSNFGVPTLSDTAAPFPLATVIYGGTLSAKVSTLVKYLKDFEQLPYFTKINNVTISSQDKSGWRNGATMSFQATLYTKAVQ